MPSFRALRPLRPSALLLALLALPACGDRKPAAVDSVPATTPAALLTAAGDTLGRTGPAAPQAVTEVCDDAEIMVQSLLAAMPERRDGEYEDSFHGARRIGCQISADARFSQMSPGVPGPVEGMMNWLAELGYRHDINFSADGPEGMLVGMRRGDVLCLVRASWLGGIGAEEEYTAEQLDEYQFRFECAIDTSTPDYGID